MPLFKNACRARHYTLLALPLALNLLPVNVQAGCSRDDIDHYLGKGFTPSQITTICGAQPVPAPQVVQQQPQVQQTAVKPPSQSTTRYTPVQQQEPDRNFLVDVINGYDIVMTDDSLAYTIKKCYELGEEDLFGFPPEICPEIRYTLNLKGMELIETGRKYLLFGPPQIKLHGQIQRDILTDLQGVKPELKELLLKKVDTGNEVVLPIQQGTPVERVQKALHKILK